ncbi:MAG: PilZ domain-containing protein [Candidatus Lindowbacteria bacterium]|nr:PilZ domain-containing protein [Candidatus Lindowbacteria bacterium]
MRTIDMFEQPKEDRRRGMRLDCFRFVCSCTLKSDSSADATGNSKKHGAVLVNVCPQGLRLESNFEPAKGEILHFELRPIVGPEVAARIKVVHTQPSATQGFYVIGSEFAELAEEESQNLLILLDTINRLEEGLTHQ